MQIHGKAGCRRTGCINGGFFVFHREIFDWLPDDPHLVFENGSTCAAVAVPAS